MADRKRAKDEVLGELHIAMAKELLARVSSGGATPADLNAAIKFLQNNKIEVDTVPNSPLDRLTKALPTFNDEDQDEPQVSH
jgi:hypothetical protein